MTDKIKNPARIVSEVETEYGLEYGDLASKKASRHISNARREAVLKLREISLSFPDIGRLLNRDHTTVMRLFHNTGSRTQKKKKK